MERKRKNRENEEHLELDDSDYCDVNASPQQVLVKIQTFLCSFLENSLREGSKNGANVHVSLYSLFTVPPHI
jgi:hypothetical protein